ncbi:MAG: acetoacetate decarboxylase family protein [Alcanivorax sp.]|nr:acetoacetate decarboxylase family protein [Alcanivorax sp.]
MSSAPVREAPAPWQLTGRAYAIALRLPDAQRIGQSGAPAVLGEPEGRYSLMMFVDYTDSDVGPYHELLFIPGSYAFADGHRHLSIGHIYVSSMDSVVNGQNNWGIPKDQASFDVVRGKREDRVTVSKDGEVFCRLTLRHGRLGVPVFAPLVPRKLRTLGQVRDGKTFIYAPSASGTLRHGQLVEGWADGTHFPEIQHGSTILGGYMPAFRMNFPVADTFSA